MIFRHIYAVYRTLTATCFIGESACQNVLDCRWSNHL